MTSDILLNLRGWGRDIYVIKLPRGGGGAYLSTFRNFHGGDSARIDVFDPFFLRLSGPGKSLGISMGETFFLLTSRLRHNN